MKFLVIIPARWGSSRLEGKPLADIAGKPMIQHVWERVIGTEQNVVVATDNSRIKDAVEAFGGICIMTPIVCESGTDRVLKAWEILRKTTNFKNTDVIINVQGDEPLIRPDHIELLKRQFQRRDVEAATLAYRVQKINELHDRRGAFVVFDRNYDAMYFSRELIPFIHWSARGSFIPVCSWIQGHPVFKHIGVYAYTPDALEAFCNIDPPPMEHAERLEQLRWLWAGRKMRVGISPFGTVPVDTPDDLKRVNAILHFGQEKL